MILCVGLPLMLCFERGAVCACVWEREREMRKNSEQQYYLIAVAWNFEALSWWESELMMVCAECIGG